MGISETRLHTHPHTGVVLLWPVGQTASKKAKLFQQLENMQMFLQTVKSVKPLSFKQNLTITGTEKNCLKSK